MVHCSTSSLTPPEQNERAREARLLRLAAFISLCPASWAAPESLPQRRELVEQRICANSSRPFGVNGYMRVQRQFDAIAFYEGLWADEEVVRLITGGSRAAGADASAEATGTGGDGQRAVHGAV